MQIDELLSASFQLLVLGLGTVFLILSVLIAGISLLSALIPAEAEVSNSTGTDTAVPAGVVAAIQAAIHHYRGTLNR